MRRELCPQRRALRAELGGCMLELCQRLQRGAAVAVVGEQRGELQQRVGITLLQLTVEQRPRRASLAERPQLGAGLTCRVAERAVQARRIVDERGQPLYRLV